MVRNLGLRQVTHNPWQYALVNRSRRKGIRQSFVDIPLSNLLVILVIAAEDDQRRMMSESLDIGDSFSLYGFHEIGVRRINAACKLEILRGGACLV